MDQPIDAVLRVLMTTPNRWITLCTVLPEDLLRRRPLDGEWSALECLQHLIDLDRGIFPQRVRALLAGEDFPAFVPDRDGSTVGADADPVAMAEEFATLRAQNLTLVETLSEADLAKTGRHSELGPVTLGHLLHEWAGHDLMHMVQAEQALMQPFIAGCGPWQVYFKGHIAAAEAD